MKLQKKKKGSLRTSTNYWEELSISIETMKEKRKRKSKKIQCMLLAYLEWIKQSGKGSVTWACLQTLHNKQSNCFIAVHTDSRMKVSIVFAEISPKFLVSVAGDTKAKRPLEQIQKTQEAKKKKAIFLVFLGGFAWIFSEIKRGWTFPENEWGMDFLGNQTGLQKNKNK